LLLLFVGLTAVVLWTVVTRKARQRAAPAAEKRELGPVVSPPPEKKPAPPKS